MKLIDELKRRNVIKATIAYIVVAWLLLQVITSVLPNFGAPPWVLKTLIFLIAIGLPIWVIFSWVYEITPEGLKKTVKVSKDESITEATNKRLNIIIIITLFIAIAVTLFQKPLPNASSITIVNNDLTLENSIAVLPFNNWSGNPQLEYISDGMTDAVITRLSAVDSLKVIPFTSVLKYKNSDQNVQSITKELGIQNVLQGNFQLSGDQVKITVHLIHGPSNTNIASNVYSGQWNQEEIFNLQAEVVKDLSRHLQIDLNSQELNDIHHFPTTNKEAYDLMLYAAFLSSNGTRKGMERAIPFYEKAIELDSTFMDAYLGLAGLYIWGASIWGSFDQQVAWKNAKNLLERAKKIDSTDKRIQRDLLDGSYLYEWDFDIMEKEFENSKAAVGYLTHVGRFEESLTIIDQKLQKKPNQAFYIALKAQALFFLNRKEEALELLVTKDKLFSDYVSYLREAAKVCFYMGEYGRSKMYVDQILSKFSDHPPIVLWLHAVNSDKAGNTIEAKNYLNKLKSAYDNGDSGSPAWFVALYYSSVGDHENAFEWLNKAYDRHEMELIWLREELALKSLRGDPRYVELYHKVGFPMPPHPN
ncbi:MAG: hypothetical protein HKP53_10505 [Eudoraea sp.]|nr:hypothetical protein [Eudoraea sp.]